MPRTVFREDFHDDVLASGAHVDLGSAKFAQCRETALYFQFGATTTQGTLEVESAPEEEYTGTWANLGTITWSAANDCQIMQITGVHGAIRVRASTEVDGDGVRIVGVGN